jgi:hypothetical protein
MDIATLAAVARRKGPAVALDIAVNFALPYIIYSYASPRYGEVHALLASSVPPILWSLLEFARNRRVDALSLMVLFGIVLSILALLGGGSARLLLLREKLATGVVAFLVSAAIGRPLIYEIARATQMRNSPTGAAELEALRGKIGFRRSMTVMTVVWGVVLVVDVGVGIALVFSLSVKQYMVVNPILGYAMLGGLSLWTFWYARRRGVS